MLTAAAWAQFGQFAAYPFTMGTKYLCLTQTGAAYHVDRKR